jgi:Domain of unknown function (DUF1707)
MAENTAQAGQPGGPSDTGPTQNTDPTQNTGPTQNAGPTRTGPAGGTTSAGNRTSNRTAGPGLRVSDAERDAVAAELADHLKDGRLQVAEFDERVSQAINARTRGDLDRLLSDLPRLTPAQRPVQPRARLPFPLVAIAIFVAGMAVLGGVGRAAASGGHPVWAIWWLWWLIPLTILITRRRMYRRGGPQD